MHRILIVDDERPARNLIAELVASYLPDARITQAESAQNALRCLQADHYDMLFVDIEMPGMTGLQLLEHLRDMGGDKTPYTFIITAFRKYEYSLNGFRLGILDYIEKPLHNEKIYNAIKMYLEKTKIETIDLKVPDGVSRIQVNRLLALKTVNRRKVMVYTFDAFLPEVAHSLTDLFKLLPSNFRYIRRDCVVNMQEVTHYNLKTRDITIDCQNKSYTFSASRDIMKEIVAFFNHSAVNHDEK